MLRIGIIYLLFIFISNAKDIEVSYHVDFGIFGKVAQVEASLTFNHTFYTIDAHVSTVGIIAKSITNNLKERHISKGHIVNSLLITDLYQMIKWYGNYTSTTIYRINHKKKHITREYKRWEKGKKVRDDEVLLSYYGKDDLMTLFLNLSTYIKEKDKHKKYRYSVVGADRKNGRVDVRIPSQKTLKQMKTLLGENNDNEWYSTVLMHRKLYHSKQGELEVKMDKHGIVKKAVLKDLIFFGDIEIIRQ